MKIIKIMFALFQPLSIIFSCMDRRVVSTKFFQSDLGDHFIVKNAGNFVPHAKQLSYESAATEPGALELGCTKEGINHVIVCGHSDCRVSLIVWYERRSSCHVLIDLREWY